MGLDAVELVMEIEDEFGLRISDAAATEMKTVGDTVRYLVTELNGRTSSGADLSIAKSFYRLRRELINRYGVSREAVRLNSPIGQLVPKQARQDWSSIADVSGLRRERRRFFVRRFPAPETSVRTLIETRC